MNVFAILILMIFLHIVDDFYLQGILAKLKQKSTWQNSSETESYKDLCDKDHIAALIIHSISWSTVILLPILFIYKLNPPLVIYILYFVNIIVHAIIDHLKANLKAINLCQDQCVHLIQIVLTWLIWLLVVYIKSIGFMVG